MAGASTPRRRARGQVEVLPSGSFRVRVYAGIDPIPHKKHYLDERGRARRPEGNPRRPSRYGRGCSLLERYLGVLKIEDTTRAGYERLTRLSVRPLLGDLPIGRIDGETLDAFYAELQRCRGRCTRRDYVDHRTTADHDCDERCGPHRCKPLGAAYVRQIHTVLNGAFTRAVKWRWTGTNPCSRPSHRRSRHLIRNRRHRPKRRTSPARRGTTRTGGMLVWLAMTTGAGRDVSPRVAAVS